MQYDVFFFFLSSVFQSQLWGIVCLSVRGGDGEKKVEHWNAWTKAD